MQNKQTAYVDWRHGPSLHLHTDGSPSLRPHAVAEHVNINWLITELAEVKSAALVISCIPNNGNDTFIRSCWQIGNGNCFKHLLNASLISSFMQIRLWTILSAQQHILFIFCNIHCVNIFGYSQCKMIKVV